jgi:lipid-A-disaccharide synthase
LSDRLTTLRIGIVANEASGDILGSGLIRALREVNPNIQFEGVGGPRMIAEGCDSLFPMERLSVMGLVEVLKHLPELLSIRRALVRRFLANPPDLFIGVDAPDFNLGLERKLKQAGIPTVHYVCPSVWAWRPKRVKKIREATDLVLSILPFEQEFLQEHGVGVAYIGHPLADEIPLETDQARARRQLDIPPDVTLVALLPGSRVGEVTAHAEVFLGAAELCRKRFPEARFVVPLVNEATERVFREIQQELTPELPVTITKGSSRDGMLAADAMLVASGTATLEGLLLRRPMVVAYRLHWLTLWMLSTFNLVKTRFISLANLVAGEEMAPEYIQQRATPEALAAALEGIFQSPERVAYIRKRSAEIHQEMRRDASRTAAEAVLRLLEINSVPP